MGGTLLVLSPEAISDELCTPELESLGYIVLYAEEAGQAMVHLRTALVDCVLIDSPTDKCDRVAAFVDKLICENEAPPFVLVSSSPVAPTYSAKLGAAAFVPKPCQANELVHVLSRMSVRPTVM